MTRRHLYILASLSIGLWSAALSAQRPQVSFSYDQVYQQTEKLAKSLAAFNLLAASVDFESSLCGVAPQNIILDVRTGDGQSALLPINRYGLLTEPLNKSFLHTGARIVSNQPKELTYHPKIVILAPTTSRLRYSWITAATEQTTQALKKMSSLPSFLLPDVTGMALIYSQAGSSVTVRGYGKDTTLQSQPANGFLGLPASTWIIKLYPDKNLAQAKATIELTGTPDHVEPLFEPDIEAAVNKKLLQKRHSCTPPPAEGTAGGAGPA